MKLLREFFRLRVAGLRALSRRGAAVPFSVTVPAPLASPADHGVVVVELPRTHAPAARREPASFLKTPRHRRRSSGR
jgi:hypothetical protein